MAASSTLLVFLFGFCCFLDFVASDTPANCTYEDVRGKWVFYMSERGHDKTVDCSKPGMLPVARVGVSHPIIWTMSMSMSTAMAYAMPMYAMYALARSILYGLCEKSRIKSN